MKRCITISIGLVCSLVGFAQQEEQVVPAQRKQLTIITEPITLYKGFLRAGFSTQFITLDKLFDSAGKKYFINENTWDFQRTISLDVSYGITDRLTVGISVPYQAEDRSVSVLFLIPSSDPTFNSTMLSTWHTSGSGIGDTDLTVRYQIVTETPRRPALRGGLRATVPTGEKNPTNVDPSDNRNYTLPTGYGEVSLDGNLMMRKISYPYSYTVGVNYVYHLAGQKIQSPGQPERPFKSSDFLFLSGSFNFHLNDWIAMQNEVDYFTFSNNGSVNNVPVDNPTWYLQYAPYLSFQIKQLRLLQGAYIPLMGVNTGADITYFLIASYTF